MEGALLVLHFDSYGSKGKHRNEATGSLWQLQFVHGSKARTLSEHQTIQPLK